jgi:molybdate transport system substrate-binding protein
LTTLNIFSAGAAQAAVSEIAEKFERDSGNAINAAYGAIGAMKARVVAGEPADVIVLSAAMIDELIEAGLVVPGSRVDLGKVGTGVAVRAGAPMPDVRTSHVLAANMLAARRIYCPDPSVATAGKVVMNTLATLGIAERVEPKLDFHPNGYAAMAALAQSGQDLEMGITQMTEIIANKGVALVGPLPPDLQNIAVYAVGLASGSARPDQAQELIRRLTGFNAQAVLSSAGFDVSTRS